MIEQGKNHKNGRERNSFWFINIAICWNNLKQIRNLSNIENYPNYQHTHAYKQQSNIERAKKNNDGTKADICNLAAILSS